MQAIDFLPVQYRQKNARRQSQPWRIVVVTAFLGLLAAAVVSQHHRKRQVDEELAAIMPQYELAVSQNRKLAELRAQLTTARTTAELFTYLRHPWPRTQVLAAVLEPLPEEITFQQLKIAPEIPSAQAPAETLSRTESREETQDRDTLPPAARDLKRLRDRFDQTNTVVSISGTTTDSAALHPYLGKLATASLFSKADLDSIEAADQGGAALSQFHLTLLVRPGYGQPGGPTGPDQRASEKSHGQTTRTAQR